MYIQLEQKDYDRIAEIVAENPCEPYILYEDLIAVHYEVGGTGYRDDNYFDGTGAYVTTSIDLNLKEVVCDGIDVRYNYDKLKKTIEDLLWD